MQDEEKAMPSGTKGGENTEKMTRGQFIAHQLGSGRVDPMPPRWQQKLYMRFHLFRRTLGAFFWLNLVIYCFCFVLFSWFTVYIVQDYIDERQDPRTVISFEADPLQPFPGMIFCNSAATVELDLDLALVLPQAFILGQIPYRDEFNITDRLDRVTFDCPADSDALYQMNCWMYDQEIPAFTVGDENTICIGKNELVLQFDVNTDQYPAFVPTMGIEIVLAPLKSISNVNMCSSQLCLAGSVPSQTNCDDNSSTDPAFDFMTASVGGLNVISLESSVIEDKLDCGRKMYRWNSINTKGTLNPKFYSEYLQSDKGEREVVIVKVTFRSQFRQIVGFESQSFASMLGSMAGWFGFLSDGWGVISLLFIIEKFVLHITRHPWRKWTQRIIPEKLGPNWKREADYINFGR